MATIRQEIISIIGPKESSTGEGNGVKSYTPQMWLVNDTDIFQIKPFLLDNTFTDLFYHVADEQYLVWDKNFNDFKPLNDESVNKFSGFVDFVFYQDENCEMRWDASADQPSFRLKGNIGWFDLSYMLTPGNSSAIRNDSQDISTYNDLNNWTSWYFWSASGALDANNDLGLYGGQGTYYIHQESQPIVGDTVLPTYQLILIKGDGSNIVTKVKRILKK